MRACENSGVPGLQSSSLESSEMALEEEAGPTGLAAAEEAAAGRSAVAPLPDVALPVSGAALSRGSSAAGSGNVRIQWYMDTAGSPAKRDKMGGL